MAYEPQVKRMPGGFPHAEVLFQTMPPTARMITVYRDGDVVRGAFKLRASLAASILDYEIPVDRTVQYHAEFYNAAGARISTSDKTPFVYHSDGLERVWIHNPFDPSVWVRTTFEFESALELVSTTNSSFHRPLGSRTPAMVAGRRTGLYDVPMSFVTETVAENDKLDQMLGTRTNSAFPVLCIRATKGLAWRRLPSPLYFGVEAVRVNVHRGIPNAIFTILGEEVEAPLAALIMPLYTRADLDAHYATRAAIDADNATRLDIDRRYDLAGTANA